jgi:predicted Zn-dependent protease
MDRMPLRHLTAVLLIAACAYAAPEAMPGAFKDSLSFVVELSKHYEILDDHPELDRLNRIGYALARELDDPENTYSFQIVKMREPNAFALPGGFIFITTGMLDLKLADAELAALVGHEIIHAAHRHAQKMQRKQTLLSLISNLVVLGALISAQDGTSKQTAQQPWWTVPDSQLDKVYATDSPQQNLLEAAIVFAAVFQELLMEGYSREYELESDRDGTYLAAHAGFDPAGVVGLMQSLRHRIYEAPGYGYWRSHPYFDDRYAMALERTKQLKAASIPADPSGLQLQAQDRFNAYASKEKDPLREKILERMALNASGRGLLGFTLHVAHIKALEADKLPRAFPDRDYGAVLKAYARIVERFRDDPEVQNGLKRLEAEESLLRQENGECRDAFADVLHFGVPSVVFLKNFLSNYPEDPETPLAALLLAQTQFQVDQEEEAVEALETSTRTGDPLYRDAAEAAALSALERMHGLSACYRLSRLFEGTWAGTLAGMRLQSLLPRAETLKDVRAFMDAYPDAEEQPAARARLEVLAREAYVKGKVLDRVGDKQRALDMYNSVLEYAPETKTAEKVRKDILNESMLKKGGIS